MTRELRWKIGRSALDLTNKSLLMGVLNVTPDSFSDGGRYFDRKAAIKHGLEMVKKGAAIMVVGGESTRPGAEPFCPNDQIERVRPVIKELAKTTRAHISVDTTSAEVAAAAIEAGATIINDISAGTGDARMFALAAETGVAIILMHMQGTPATMQIAPAYDDVVAEVAEFFRQQFAQAVRSGIDPMCIAFDPGIGFGKTLQHNLALLANLARLRVEGRPLVVGVSRKSFLGKISGGDGNRESATIAMTSLLRERGAQILRVHEVAPNLQALRATEALLAAEP
jgi:dihydropteroate synthase